MRAWVGLEHMLYCSAEMFGGAAALAEEFDTGIHTHSSETVWEVQESLRLFGRRPIEEFYNRGILGEQTVVAHCVWLDDREVELMARTGTAATHCPCSNMKLASGPARIGHYRSSGMTVGLGDPSRSADGDVERLQELPGLRAPVRQLRTPCDVTRSGVTPGPPPRPRSAGVPPRPGRSSSAGGIGEQWKCHIFQTGFPSPSSRW